jgi:hypothetical protein
MLVLLLPFLLHAQLFQLLVNLSVPLSLTQDLQILLIHLQRFAAFCFSLLSLDFHHHQYRRDLHQNHQQIYLSIFFFQIMV